MTQSHQSTRRIITLRRLICAVVLFSVCVGVLGLWGCTTTIIPPSAQEVADDPVHVHVADYGRHSSIMLPLCDDEESMVEYGFGEWRFFALDHEGITGVARALFVASDGTLSRRFVQGPFTEENLQPLLRFHRLYTIRVHRGNAVELREKLNRRYERNIETEVYNPRVGLHFVKVDEQYSFGNNCNPVLARWLRQLGCELRGPALLSSWSVREAD